MLIHPWDAAVDDEEWRTWLADGHDFGQLVVNGLPGQPPTVDDPAEKAELLARQLAHFQPAGDHPDIAVGAPPYGRMLPGIRGLRLQVAGVAAKFKYNDSNPTVHRAQVATRLAARATGRDTGAAGQQQRRLGRIGTWRLR